jgi:hypothetical protein
MKKYLILFTSFVLLSCENKIDGPSEINELFSYYNKAWSDGKVEDIIDNVYGVPCTLYLPDGVVPLNSKNDIRNFLNNTFAELDKNNYGFSKFNNWEHVRLSQNVAIVEQNFTRYLKDDTVMGPKERTASYVLRKDEDSKYKIYALIIHSPLSE